MLLFLFVGFVFQNKFLKHFSECQCGQSLHLNTPYNCAFTFWSKVTRNRQIVLRIPLIFVCAVQVGGMRRMLLQTEPFPEVKKQILPFQVPGWFILQRLESLHLNPFLPFQSTIPVATFSLLPTKVNRYFLNEINLYFPMCMI